VLSRRIDPALRRQLLLAAGVYLAGAVGVEGLSALVHDDAGHGRVYVAVTALEEGLELLGVLLALYAVASRLRLSTSAGGLLLELSDTAPPPVAPQHDDRTALISPGTPPLRRAS
jgi:hypothetical protein